MSVEELENSWSAIVDIGGKDMVFREAIATGVLELTPSGINEVKGRSKKGDVSSWRACLIIFGGTLGR